MPNQKTVLGRMRGRVSAAARRQVRTVLPASFRSHLKASIREGLLAFESLFDEAVKALERESRKGPDSKGKKIKVQ